MPVNWALANQGQYDYLDSLRSLGEAQTRQLQNQATQHKLVQLARQDAARPGIQQQVATRDYSGAQAAALGAGDFDMAKTIGGLADDQRKQLAQQNDWMGRAATSLRRVPVENRATVFAAMVPHLRGLGFGEAELSGIRDFSDENLDYFTSMSQSIKDQLAGQLTQTRIDDVGYDNDRADLLADNTIRNTDDMIADRAGRRALTARGQDMSDARGRYGIGVASADRRRGQDITSADRQRGQNISATRPRGGKNGTAPNIPTVQTPDQARALPPGTVFRTPDGKVKVR